MTDKPLTPDELESALRVIGAERYHNRHPFHKLLHGGKLSQGQIQAWALNRYYYQRCIPIKDATLMARLPTPELRRHWRSPKASASIATTCTRPPASWPRRVLPSMPKSPSCVIGRLLLSMQRRPP